MKKILVSLVLLSSIISGYSQQIFFEDFQSYEGFGDQPTGGWSTTPNAGFKVYIRSSTAGNIKVCDIVLNQNKKGDSLTTPSFGPLTETAVLNFDARLLDSYIGNFPGFNHIVASGDKVSAFLSTDGGPYVFLQDLLPSFPRSSTAFVNFSIPLNGMAGTNVKVKIKASRTASEWIPSFDNFSASNITSTKSLKIAQDISLSPNPSHGLVQVNAPGFGGKAQIEVYNLLGSKVFNSVLQSEKTNLDLSALKTGIYLIKVSEGKQVAVSRLILK